MNNTVQSTMKRKTAVLHDPGSRVISEVTLVECRSKRDLNPCLTCEYSRANGEEYTRTTSITFPFGQEALSKSKAG